MMEGIPGEYHIRAMPIRRRGLVGRRLADEEEVAALHA